MTQMSSTAVSGPAYTTVEEGACVCIYLYDE